MEISEYHTNIFTSCRNGSLSKGVLETVDDISSLRDENGKSLLDTAIACGAHDIVELLLQRLPILSMEDSCRHLASAAETGRLGIFRLVSDHITVNNSSLASESLKIACTKGLSDMVALILSRYPDVTSNAVDQLLIACKHGNIAIIRQLLDAGVLPVFDFGGKSYTHTDSRFFTFMFEEWNRSTQHSEEHKDAILTMLQDVRDEESGAKLWYLEIFC
jgi:ankyrin repeat protein